jgi:hypothetical protein
MKRAHFPRVGCSENHRNPLKFGLTTMVSDVDFLLNQSIDICRSSHLLAGDDFDQARGLTVNRGRTKVPLVELPAMNMFGFFFCTSFPRGILAWSCALPRSHFHPPTALHSYILKRG